VDGRTDGHLLGRVGGVDLMMMRRCKIPAYNWPWRTSP